MIVIMLLECLVRFNLSHKILYLAALCHCNRSIVQHSLVYTHLVTLVTGLSSKIFTFQHTNGAKSPVINGIIDGPNML